MRARVSVSGARELATSGSRGSQLWARLHRTTSAMQHAAIAVYNAYCDRGARDRGDGAIFWMQGQRRGYVDWLRSSLRMWRPSCASTPKWDRRPHILVALRRESMVRAYKAAVTPPMIPVALVCDEALPGKVQSHAISTGAYPNCLDLFAPRPIPTRSPSWPKCWWRRRTRPLWRRAARARPRGCSRWLEPRRALRAPVVRSAFPAEFPHAPSTELLIQNPAKVISAADVIVGLEVRGLLVRRACLRTGERYKSKGDYRSPARRWVSIHRDRFVHQERLPGTSSATKERRRGD